MKRFVVVFLAIGLMALACFTATSLLAGDGPDSTEAPQAEAQPPEKSAATPTRTPEERLQPTSTFWLPPVWTPTPEPVAEVQVVQTTSYCDDLEQLLRVIGLVQNTGEADVRRIRVFGTAWGADGNEVALEQISPTLPLVRPDEIVPFELVLPGEAPHDYTIDVVAEAEAALPSEQDSYHRELEVMSYEYSLSPGGYYEIRGEVRNTGETEAILVRINAMLFDAAGTLIGLGHGFLQDPVVPARSTSPFQIEHWNHPADLVKDNIARIEFILHANK